MKKMQQNFKKLEQHKKNNKKLFHQIKSEMKTVSRLFTSFAFPFFHPSNPKAINYFSTILSLGHRQISFFHHLTGRFMIE
jgi:hypothetical protein